MKPSLLLLALIPLLAIARADNTAAPDGFVHIPDAQYGEAPNPVNIAAFEIMDHPVTNAEYKRFTDATHFPTPTHWENGTIPAGYENHPVIFVNREDVAAYAEWLTKTTDRLHRLPSVDEFQLAARSGKPSTEKYYWGKDDSPLKNPDAINYNSTRDRPFNQWRAYLKPARWGQQNAAGLYQMAGNVWHLLHQETDLAKATYKYRIETPVHNERAITGGSWATPKEYLVCGKTFMLSPGIRHPDVGFRLVRDPANTDRRIINRQVAAANLAPDQIGITWALLATDKPETKFNIYRIAGSARPNYGVKLNATPLANTSYVDTTATAKTRYQYRIVPIDDTREHNPSEWTGITSGDTPYPIVAKFKPMYTQGDLVPVFGNLEGYGRLNCVIRLDNGCKDSSQDPGLPVQLEAFSYTGKSLWRKDIARHENIYGSGYNAPFCIWDMDGDGKDEVITLLQIGEQNHVAILDGMSGKLLHKTPWPPMATDHSRASTRLQMSIAYLDGKTPAVITQTGLYENEIITAYDHRLNKLWDYKSFAETSGSGGHKIEIADVDGDGRHEIIYGTTCLNPDGTMRWAIYRQHPDIISIHDYIPSRPGLEVCFIVETSAHAGIYMADANTGEVIWKSNREDDPNWTHGHSGWTADIWAGSPGMECVSNRKGHNDKNFILFSADGKRLLEGFPPGLTPVEWDGDHTRELLASDGKKIGKFNGKTIDWLPNEIPNPIPNTKIEMVADLCGDFRTELVLSGTDTDGRTTIFVVTAPKSIAARYVSPRETLDYRLWLARNKGGGYGSIYDTELVEK